VTAGDRFGRYRIIRLLGRGAMGEVYLATDNETRGQVALKIVYKGPSPEDQDVVDAERVGAELQKRLGSADKHVVKVTRYGEIHGDLFIEMEYIEGEDLSTILARGPVKSSFAAFVAMELCDLLENISAFTTTIGDRQFIGVVHGDLKPRNIRLNGQNHVKVLDFGIAKALSLTSRYTMNMFASAAYCSPERLDTHHIDLRSDLWSVGVLLYQMAAGRLPFDESDRARLERRIRLGPAPDALPDACPEPLRRIIFKMLARDPAKRYEHASDARADLARFQNGEPVTAGPIPTDAFDSDATTRTLGNTSSTAQERDDDRTVRTMPPKPAPPPIPAPSRAGTSHFAMGCLGLLGIGVLAAVTFGIMQYRFVRDARQLKDDVNTERVTNLDEAWTRYKALNARTHIPGTMLDAGGALKKRFVARADAVIAEYRSSDSPAVYETHWKLARNDLARALELDAGDNAITGRLRVCEGHLDRINAQKLHGVARQRVLNGAVAKFTDAAGLLKRSPDPYLGLARIYSYEMNDPDRAEDAFNRAADHDHTLGKREQTQLAEAYRVRADRLWRESRRFAHLPGQEREFLDKARQDYMHAEDLYAKVGIYGDVPRTQVAVYNARQRVEQRLNEIHNDPGDR